MAEGLHYFKTRRDESVRIMSMYLKGADIEAMKQGWVAYAERIFPVKPYPSEKGMELVIREVASQNPAASKVTPRVSSTCASLNGWTAAASSTICTANGRWQPRGEK